MQERGLSKGSDCEDIDAGPALERDGAVRVLGKLFPPRSGCQWERMYGLRARGSNVRAARASLVRCGTRVKCLSS